MYDQSSSTIVLHFSCHHSFQFSFVFTSRLMNGNFKECPANSCLDARHARPSIPPSRAYYMNIRDPCTGESNITKVRKHSSLQAQWQTNLLTDDKHSSLPTTHADPLIFFLLISCTECPMSKYMSNITNHTILLSFSHTGLLQHG